MSIRESLSDYFEDFDFDVRGAETAEEALEILKEFSCHVAIVDMRLPGMDGNAFIEKAHEFDPAIRYIVHTGSVNYALSGPVKAIGVQPEHVFFKPISNMQRFVETIIALTS